MGKLANGNEEKEKKYLDESIFEKKNETDLFVSKKEIEIPEEYKFNLKNLILKLIKKIKRTLKKL